MLGQTCGRRERAHRSLQNRRRFRTAPTRLIIVSPSAERRRAEPLRIIGHRPTDSAEEAKIQAYVFVDTVNPGPKHIVAEIRKLDGVVRADALFGAPDVLVLVEGEDVAAMDAVIDRIVEIEGVVDSESKVVRWV
jgi:DNA-binding Lrp family transcriptional regulator